MAAAVAALVLVALVKWLLRLACRACRTACLGADAEETLLRDEERSDGPVADPTLREADISFLAELKDTLGYRAQRVHGPSRKLHSRGKLSAAREDRSWRQCEV